MAGSDSDDSLEIIEEKSTHTQQRDSTTKKQETIELLSETDTSDSDSNTDVQITQNSSAKVTPKSSHNSLKDGHSHQPSSYSTKTIREALPVSNNSTKRPLSMRALAAEAAMRRLKYSKLGKQQSESLILEQPNSTTKITHPGPRESKPKQKPISTSRDSALNQQETPPLATYYKSQVRLIGNKEYCGAFQDGNGDTDTVTMTDLVGSSILEKTYQFNFMIDANFLLSFINADPLNVEIILINSGQADHLLLDALHKMQFRIRNISVADITPQFGSHHTKMMINFFHDDTCQIVVHTMNLTSPDYKIQTQMAWISPRLRRLKSESDYQDFEKETLDLIDDNGVIFKKDLIKYIRNYKLSEFGELIEELSKYDFGKVDAQFIASSPGTYEFEVDRFKPNKFSAESDLYGYGKLYQLMQEYSLSTPHNTMLIAQPSTIAYPVDSRSRNIFLHLLTSVMEGSPSLLKDQNFKFTNNPNYTNEPIIIWPTDKEIVSNYYKEMSGNALFFQTKKNPSAKFDAPGAHYNTLKNVLHRWNSKSIIRESEAGRSRLSPHVKTYTATDDDFKSLKWFLLTSANLSKQAWGAPTSFARNSNQQKVHKYIIRSFETGVLINPKTIRLNKQDNKKKVVLTPVFGRDTLGSSLRVNDERNEDVVRFPVRLPYDVPLKKYNDGDLPWSKEAMAKLYQG